MIKVNPNQLLNKDIFMKNVSNPNSNIILNEKYFAEVNPQIEHLNELFNENFLKENQRLIHNYHENKRLLLKSSQLNKQSNNANNNSASYSSSVYNNNNSNNNQNNVNVKNSSTKIINGILENSSISNRKSVSSMLPKNQVPHRRNFSMIIINSGNRIFNFLFIF